LEVLCDWLEPWEVLLLPDPVALDVVDRLADADADVVGEDAVVADRFAAAAVGCTTEVGVMGEID